MFEKLLQTGLGETDVEVKNIESLIKLSKTKVEFLENFDILSIEKIRQIELRGQCCNDQWYLCEKVVIIASKAHEVTTKMKKVRKGGGAGRGVVNIWSLKKKNFWNDICQFKHPCLKTWKRRGN